MDWQTDGRLTRRMALALGLSAAGYAVLLGPVFVLLALPVALVVCGVLLASSAGWSSEPTASRISPPGPSPSSVIRIIVDYFRIAPTPGSARTGKSLQ